MLYEALKYRIICWNREKNLSVRKRKNRMLSALNFNFESASSPVNELRESFLEGKREKYASTFSCKEEDIKGKTVGPLMQAHSLGRQFNPWKGVGNGVLQALLQTSPIVHAKIFS